MIDAGLIFESQNYKKKNSKKINHSKRNNTDLLRLKHNSKAIQPFHEPARPQIVNRVLRQSNDQIVEKKEERKERDSR